MRIAIAATSALALALSMPVLAQGNGQGNGKGNGNGNGNGNAAAKAKPGNGNGNGRGNGNGNLQRDRGNDGPRMQQRGNGNGNAANARQQAEREVERRIDRREDRREDRRDDRRDVRRDDRRDNVVREVVRVVDRDDARRVLVRYENDYRPVQNWCPPGLAKKGNGCQPPGQAKKLRDDRFGGYYGSVYPRLSGDDWRYYDGYAYRLRGGVIDALIPLVGGALFGGNQWPTAYNDYRAPAYYGSYFGQNPRYDYYYADRTLFSVDPKDQAIRSIAALLTGNDISVGQPLPVGYSVYNVPYQYRSRYADGPDAYYRYSDGYVYRVDPETELVAEVIDLLV